jgi:hypothetical protein
MRVESKDLRSFVMSEQGGNSTGTLLFPSKALTRNTVPQSDPEAWPLGKPDGVSFEFYKAGPEASVS